MPINPLLLARIALAVALFAAGWLANGWRTADRKAVKNQDLWQRLAAAAAPHQVSWEWVRGHDGHVENERVDRAARAQAELFKAAS